MRRTLLLGLLCLGVGLFPAAPARAMGILLPGNYDLLDHGDGNQGPDYGLRMDSIDTIFSVEIGGAHVVLGWDGGATATLIGQLHDNATSDLWDVDYTLTGVVAAGGDAGFTATGGFGTLTDPLNAVISMTGKQDGSGIAFRFLADGHRIDGDSTSPVGRGWLQPPGSVDDWLVRAKAQPPIPEPGSGLLLLSGCLVVGIYGLRVRSR